MVDVAVPGRVHKLSFSGQQWLGRQFGVRSSRPWHVHLPCAGYSDWEEMYIDCLSDITKDIMELDFESVVFGGDLNIDLSASSVG